MEKKKNRVFYFDVLNIVACMGVVFLHCCTKQAFEYEETSAWYVAVAIQCLFYWCVPVFFMLTGATLLNYRERYSTKEYFKRRVLRILIPFLIWNTIWLLYRLPRNEFIIENDLSILNGYLCNGFQSIYWFFFPLLAMYLMMPVLSVLTEQKYQKVLVYLAVLSLAFGTIVEYSYLYGIYYYELIIPPFVSCYVSYVLLGWILSRWEIPPKIRLLIYAAGLVCAGIMFFGTIMLTHRDGEMNQIFFSYNMYTAFGIASAIFVWFRYRDWSWLQGEKCRRAVRMLSGASFGVYLMQMWFIEPLYWHRQPEHLILWMIIGGFGVYAACVLIVIAIKKIPVLRKLFP